MGGDVVMDWEMQDPELRATYWLCSQTTRLGQGGPGYPVKDRGVHSQTQKNVLVRKSV